MLNTKRLDLQKNIRLLLRNHFYVCFLVIIVKFSSCLSAGTHGCIKAYAYPVKKNELQHAVNAVISNSNNLTQDTIPQNPLVDVTNGKHDTIKGLSNDAYVELYISRDGKKYRYTFRYTGNKNDWNRDTTSEIFIAYAHDENGRGGSEGNGGIGWYTPFLKKKLIKVFEEEFIDKIDENLKVKHRES